VLNQIEIGAGTNLTFFELQYYQYSVSDPQVTPSLSRLLVTISYSQPSTNRVSIQTCREPRFLALDISITSMDGSTWSSVPVGPGQYNISAFKVLRPIVHCPKILKQFH